MLLLIWMIGALWLRKVEACFQHFLSVQLRARTITGRVSRDGKPSGGALLRLHKSLGAYSVQLSHADRPVLSEVVSAPDGTFHFGEVPSGKYVVLLGPPSGTSMDVELFKPKSADNESIAIENFADGCVTATVVAADGTKIRQR
jgi:hypothetical protein